MRKKYIPTTRGHFFLAKTRKSVNRLPELINSKIELRRFWKISILGELCALYIVLIAFLTVSGQFRGARIHFCPWHQSLRNKMSYELIKQAGARL